MEQTNASEEIKKRFDEYFKGNIDENSYLHINTVYVRNFIQSEIDLAVSKERERITQILLQNVLTIQDHGQFFKPEVINLINTK